MKTYTTAEALYMMVFEGKKMRQVDDYKGRHYYRFDGGSFKRYAGSWCSGVKYFGDVGGIYKTMKWTEYQEPKTQRQLALEELDDMEPRWVFNNRFDLFASVRVDYVKHLIETYVPDEVVE